MKKTLLVLTTFLTIAFASAQTAGASFTDGLYSYVVQADVSQVFISETTATGDLTFPTSATDGTHNYAVTGATSGLINFGAGITSIVIPTGYITFEAGCFRGMADLVTLTFNSGEVFGDKMCRDLDLLKTVVLPNTITSWGEQIFSESEALSSIDLGICPTINNRMFRNTSVTQLTLPVSVTTIGADAWNGSPVVTLIVEGTVPPVIDPGWAGTAANITAYVPTANVTDYQNAAIWSDMNIKDEAILLDAQVVVNNLADFRSAVQFSDKEITLEPGNYNLEDLPSDARVINCTGSNNTIILTDVYVSVLVGSFHETYFIISGNDNIVIGGEFEDVYSSGITEITDFSAYNQDRANLANGLGDANMEISGRDNLIDGLKLTVRGSFPYGYGSMYGINGDNSFGLDKHSGLVINGPRNTLDNVELQQRAFGHGIFMQGDADETVIKNTLVEGRVRPTGDLYQEDQSYDLPYRAGFKMPYEGNRAIPTDEVHSLSEDGIRSYSKTGSVTVENCTVKKMRGGIRLYLASAATITNSTSIDCGTTNWNLPNNAVVTKSSGNFAYSNLSDFRLSRSGMNIEWTIIPSPHAMGPHNLADVLGNSHNIVFHRTPGPVDTDLRPIVITGDNSTIVNETEYPIILESSASGNTIVSCGLVTDNGSNNSVSVCDDPNLSISNSKDISKRLFMCPNPVSSTAFVKNAINSTLSIYSINGSLVFTKVILSDSEVINLSSLTPGVYFAELIDVSSREVMKLVKE